MDTLYSEVLTAEDKLAATLYSIKSDESLYAENILGENAFHYFISHTIVSSMYAPTKGIPLSSFAPN